MENRDAPVVAPFKVARSELGNRWGKGALLFWDFRETTLVLWATSTLEEDEESESHPDTIFRVRVLGLNPGTTYYYKVDSIKATGQSDGVKSPVERFTTLHSFARFQAARRS